MVKLGQSARYFRDTAENAGEYRKPGTRYFADGFCSETNTIYEYAGSFYHSDPRLFDHSVEHPSFDEHDTWRKSCKNSGTREGDSSPGR